MGSVSTIEECCHPASIGGLEGEGYTRVGSTSCSECPVNSENIYFEMIPVLYIGKYIDSGLPACMCLLIARQYYMYVCIGA